MAVVKQTLVDSDFEHVVKVTTTGTNSGANIVDASALAPLILTLDFQSLLVNGQQVHKQTFYLMQTQTMLHYH